MKRTVLWKRMTALALAAILLLGLLPAAVLGAEPSDELMLTKYVYEEVDGVCRAVREEESQSAKPAAHADTSAQSSGKLAAPTNLRWETAYKVYTEEHDGNSYSEKVYPGCISWDDAKNSVKDYRIAFYDASGNEVCRSHWLKKPEMDSYHVDDFLIHIETSGTYRFSVQAVDKDDPGRNSEVAYSDWWTYYSPNQTLDVPVGLYADGTTLHWPAVARAGGYYVEEGYSEAADGDIFWYGSTWWRSSDDTDYDITQGEDDQSILTTAGYYFYHVRALSNDITKYNNSGYGELYRVYSDGKGNLSKAENQTYTVAFEDPDRGICFSRVSGLLSGSLVPQPDTPKRTGYRFAGWYPNRSRSGNAWNFQTNVITGNLTLYAKWELSPSFSQPDDVFPFTNSRSYFCSPDYDTLSWWQKRKFKYDISDSDFARLLQNLPNASYVAKLRMSNLRNAHWEGSCFGMSSVTLLMAYGLIQPSNYGYNQINKLMISINSDGAKDVGRVESLINYYHLLQSIGELAIARANFSQTDESANLKNLIDTIQAVHGAPVLIGLSFQEGGHAVIGYNMQYDEAQQKYTIQIYDCAQSVSHVYPLTIYKKGTTYEKSCDEWQRAWNGAGKIFIKYTLTPEDYQKMPYLMRTVQAARAKAPADYRLTTSFDSFTVSNGTDATTVTGGEIDGADALGLTVLGGEGEPGFALSFVTLLPALETGAYTITPAPSDEEEYTLELLYDDDTDGFFHLLTSAAPAAVTLSSAGVLTTATAASAAQTLTSAYNGSRIAADGVTVSGETTGFTAKLENGAVDVTSQQETQAELTLSSGLKEQTQTLSLGSSAVTLKADASDKTCSITRGDEAVASVSLGYAVVFDARGGSQTPTQFVQSGKTAAVPGDPVYEGYLFHGWFTDEACTEPWSFDTAVTEDQLLYADWRPDPAMWKTVVFRVNGVDDQTILVRIGDTLTEADIPASDLYAGAKIVWDQKALAQLLDTSIWQDHVIPGDAVPLPGQSVLTLNATKSADGVTATVKNDAAINFRLTLFAAAYDADGRMLACQAVPFTAEANRSTTVTTAPIAGAVVIRCYLMDSCFIPACPRVELN